MSKLKNVIVIENSPIIQEGLAGMIKKTGQNYRLWFAGSVDDAELLYSKNKCSLIIANPSLLQVNSKPGNLKNRFGSAKWVALVYAFYDTRILSWFDGVIAVSDSGDTIATLLEKITSNGDKMGQNPQDILTDRETEVLKLLATGLTNKEIADKLNISTNTVITHRKNISQKTGIKSVSGLTIFAVAQKLISIDNLQE